MNHLSDSQLNEYLDNVLDEARQDEVDLHLAACEECRARLEGLQMLFSNLENLHEVKLAQDLTSSIIARLPDKQHRVWTSAFAAQLGAALGVLVWLSVQVTKSVMPFLAGFQFSTSHFALPSFNFPLLTSPFSILNLHTLFSIPYPLFPILHFPSSIFNFPTFQLFNLPAFQPLDIAQGRLSTFNIIVIAASVFVLWLVGNLSLLRNRPGVQK